MSSIYRKELGDDFERLHPRMQWRFGFSSLDETCQIGHGVMHAVWRGERSSVVGRRSASAVGQVLFESALRGG